MKHSLSLPKLIMLIFGLSLVSLSTYISFLFQPGFELNRYHLTLVVEASEQRVEDEEWYFSSLHKHDPIGWITTSSPPTSQRHLELSQRTVPVDHWWQASERRLVVKQWIMVAIAVVAIPLSAYTLLKSKHRLGGWKEANLQFRTIVEHH